MPPKQQPDDFRAYLELRFNRNDEDQHEIKEQLKDIRSVTEGIIRTMNQMTLTQELHFVHCPNTTEVAKINTTLSEFMFFKKYRKPLLIGSIVIFLFSIFGVSLFIHSAELLFAKYPIAKTTTTTINP